MRKLLAVMLPMLSAVALFLAPSASRADSLQFDLGATYAPGGVDLPSGTPLATFRDIADGEVQLEMDLTLLQSSGNPGYAQRWFFNLDDQTNLGGLVFAHDTLNSTGPEAKISKRFDRYGAGGYGLFDLRFGFGQKYGFEDEFQEGEKVVYTITGDGITATDFQFKSTSGNYSATKFYVDGGSTVAWMVDEDGADVFVNPEPATLVLMGSGLLGIGGLVRRNNRKKIAKAGIEA